MTNAEILDMWLETITAHNKASAGAWTVRFEIDGARLIEQAVKRVETVGATVSGNGGPLEYVATFPRSNAREVASMLVDAGARLCSDQTVTPFP